jgi:UDP-N-acetylglucosamine--N-acetylmuramyl-(pentapeptide) pyrophosphoryl-undecaprenol N-acetylglucosamine transferase
MDDKYRILIATGGTGGHIYPAIALAYQYEKDGHQVIIAGTGNEIEKKIFSSEDLEVKYFPSKLKDYPAYKKFLMSFWVGEEVKNFVREMKPDMILGMGGYASSELCRAGAKDTCVIIQEQNSVVGRVNKFLLFFRAVAGIQGLPGAFTWFEKLSGIPFDLKFLGNPVRKDILDLKKTTHEAEQSNRLKVFIMGGSQGARSINISAPNALSLVSASIDIEVRHDAGEQDYVKVKESYNRLGINAQVSKFNSNVGSAYAWADLFIGRAGAMTVSELSAIGLPSILIPFPHAMDNHQFYNARFLEEKGGAVIINDENLTSEHLAETIKEIVEDKRTLEKMSESAFDDLFLHSTENIVNFTYDVIKNYKLPGTDEIGGKG